MISQRAYYRDAYTTHFPAVVLQALEYSDQPAVILDRTFFYPTSGGQPHDTGVITQSADSALVLDVVERESDANIIHVLDKPLKTGVVTGEIDWPRRFDHMQQHTGQHILSQAFIRTAEATTIGFHLSGQTVTIDLDCPSLSTGEITAAEMLANQIVWQDRPVRALEVTWEEAKQLPLRKLPPGRDGQIRLIDIEDFDLTACGGTHVARSGAVGAIKIIKTERRGQAHRIEFCCGRRALEDYRQKHDAIQAISGRLTTSINDLVASVARLQDEGKQLRNDLKRSQAALLAYEAEQLLSDAEQMGPWRLIRRVFVERDPGEVRLLGNMLANYEATIALLGIAGERAQLIYCRSIDAPGAMGDLIRPSLALLGSARGGGSPTFASGGGSPADETTVAEAIAAAVIQLREVVNGIE